MAKPCHFCGQSTNLEVIANDKTRSWFLNPSKPYPACAECKAAHDSGDNQKILEAMQSKYLKRKMEANTK